MRERLRIGDKVIATFPALNDLPAISITGTVVHVHSRTTDYFAFDVLPDTAKNHSLLDAIPFRADEVKRADPSDHQ